MGHYNLYIYIYIYIYENGSRCSVEAEALKFSLAFVALWMLNRVRLNYQ
jgi:hypothetical protein